MSQGTEAAYDAFLAQLVFSTNDPRIDIVENIDLASDPAWLSWLERKVATSTDVEEKMALNDLNEMVIDIVKRINLSKATDASEVAKKEEAERVRIQDAEARAAQGAGMSDADVLRAAGAGDRAGMDDVVEAEVA